MADGDEDEPASSQGDTGKDGSMENLDLRSGDDTIQGEAGAGWK
jgi:hypothetical protein